MSAQVVQIGAIAILLLIAYASGWAIGYRAHRFARHRSKPEPLASRVPPPTAGTIIGTSSGAAPVVASATEAVGISATIPEPLGLAPLPADEQGGIQPPAMSALETLKSLSTTMPLLRTVQPAAGEAGQEPGAGPGDASAIVPRGETVAKVLTETPEPARPAPGHPVALDQIPAPAALPAVAPGLAWSGTIGGREAEPFAPVTAADGRGGAGPPVHPGVSVSDEAAAKLDAPLEPEVLSERGFDLPKLVDEDSAMRDIEGGWSRRGAWAAGDMTEVSAAVNAAQVAVEQVLARDGVDSDALPIREQAAFGKPHGLPCPRDGGRDDLKQIAGLGPMDETALNNLGIYHFDQIASLDDREVLWLENHAFARGRIGRENWRQQARGLVAETAVLRMER